MNKNSAPTFGYHECSDKRYTEIQRGMCKITQTYQINSRGTLWITLGQTGHCGIHQLDPEGGIDSITLKECVTLENAGILKRIGFDDSEPNNYCIQITLNNVTYDIFIGPTNKMEACQRTYSIICGESDIIKVQPRLISLKHKKTKGIELLVQTPANEQRINIHKKFLDIKTVKEK